MANKQLKKKIQHHSDTFYITRQKPGIVQLWNDSRTQVNRNRRETKKAISKASIMVPSSAPEIVIPYNGTPVKDKATHVSYIGGDRDAARKAYWEEAPIIKAATDSIAGRYGINPELLRSRLNKEGFTDSAINLYNDINTNVNADNRSIIRAKVLGYPYLHSEGEHNIGIQRFGLDDGATYINSGLAHLINESWNDGEFTNEKGRVTNAANGASILDNMGIMASLIRGFRDQAAKDYPNATPEELDNYANIYYNRGITGGRNYINNGNGSTPYTMSEGGPLQTHKTWDDLSMTEKADMMKVAVRNGITSLNEIKAHYNEFAEGGNLYGGGSYLDKAKAMIRANEGWRSTPYKDAPKGKNWRSVGYGFNDSGFWEKYPEGISKHYEKGMTKAQAEQELTYYLGKAERQLRGIYGKRWDSFNDDQKAAILDTYYQSPASVGSKSGFYSAVMAGRDGAPYLGVRGFGDRNQSRRDLYRGRGVSAPMTFDTISEPVSAEPDMISFKPLNPQAFDNPMFTYTPPTLMEEPVQVNPLAEAYSPEELERQEKRDNLERFNMFMNMLSGSSGEDNTGLTGMLGAMSMLSGNKKAYGGNLFDGDTEPTQQMQQGYIRQRPEGTYFYDIEGQPEIDVTPLNTSLSSNPSDWSFTDAAGKIYSPHRDAIQGTGELREGSQEGPILSAVNNYLRELNWRVKNDPASIALQGKYTMPTIAATGLLPWLGEAAAATNVAGVPLTTLADAGLTAGFGAHGLNHWINEGINGWGDAAMTALEVAPLGRLAKPIYNTSKEAFDAGRNYAANYYNSYKNVRNSQRYMQNIEKEYDDAISQITNKYKEDQPLSESDAKLMKKISGDYINKLYGENADIKGLSYFAKDKSIAGKIKEKMYGNEDDLFATPEEVLKQSIKDFNSIKPGHTAALVENGATSKDSYPLLASIARRRMRKGEGDIIPVIDNGIYRMMRLNNYGKGKKSILNIDKNIQELREITGDANIPNRFSMFGDHYVPAFIFKKASPQITAENAASITPEQWTAAQDAAIARGDMAEAHRLRDLHFKVNAPDADLPVQFHGTKGLDGNKIVFGHPSRYGYTNYPFYTSSNEFYASLYGPKKYKFYVNENDANLLKASDKENFMTVSKDRFNELAKRGNGTRDISRNDEITIFDPTKYKLANALTYDDKGVRIPLGERDNFNINDIRYGLLPFGIGLTGYGILGRDR